MKTSCPNCGQKYDVDEHGEYRCVKCSFDFFVEEFDSLKNKNLSPLECFRLDDYAFKKILKLYASNKIDVHEARMKLKKRLDELEIKMVTEGSPYDIYDHINFILETYRKMASNSARRQSQDALELVLYPAWSLECTDSRLSANDDWQSRWFAAGNACGWNGAVRTRFVALKTSPIWEKLGEGAGGFENAFGNPYPPFAYLSGMNWVDIDADESKVLGLDVDS